MKREKALTLITAMLIAVFLLTALAGCEEATDPTSADATNPSYKVDYCGQQDQYLGAEDSYEEGEEVVIRYTHLATEYSYNFFLDGEEIDTEYDSDKGHFILRFTMPDHDITLECKSYNSWGAVYDETPTVTTEPVL